MSNEFKGRKFVSKIKEKILLEKISKQLNEIILKEEEKYNIAFCFYLSNCNPKNKNKKSIDRNFEIPQSLNFLKFKGNKNEIRRLIHFHIESLLEAIEGINRKSNS